MGKNKPNWNGANLDFKVKHLKNADVINQDEITIDDLDSFWSSGCSGR